MSFRGRVVDILEPCQGLGVGVGNSRQIVLLGQGHNVVGRAVVMFGITGVRLRYHTVLTVRAAKVATRTGYRQTACAGVPLGQGFLLYRVVGDGAGTAIDHRVEFSADVLPRPAQARLPLGYAASVRTKTAAHAVAIGVIKHTFFHVFDYYKITEKFSSESHATSEDRIG